MNFHVNKSFITLAATGCLLFLPVHQVNAGSKYMWNLSKIGVNKTMHKNAKKRGTKVKVGVLDGLVRCNHKRRFNFQVQQLVKSWY